MAMRLEGTGAASGGGGNEDPLGGDAIVAEINVTPLVDVFLLLLVIFMVTSSVISQTSIPVQLPQSGQAADSTQTEPAVIVTVDAVSNLFVNGIAVKDYQLGQALTLALGQSQNKTVILEGDQQAMLGTVVRVMDEGKKAGATGFAVAAKAGGGK
jgi:biopolymer transport protein ExbD